MFTTCQEHVFGSFNCTPLSGSMPTEGALEGDLRFGSKLWGRKHSNYKLYEAVFGGDRSVFCSCQWNL